MPDQIDPAKDTRTRREKVEDMARLGTPAERKVAAAFLAVMPPDPPKANPMAAPPRQRPPVVTYQYGGQTVRVTHVNLRDAMKDAAQEGEKFEAAWRRVEEQLAKAAGGSAELEEALRKFAEQFRTKAQA